jgi:integrase/recombinase XerD
MPSPRDNIGTTSSSLVSASLGENPPRGENVDTSSVHRAGLVYLQPRHDGANESSARVIPAFGGSLDLTKARLRDLIAQAAHDWLARTSSVHTRDAYVRDLMQFCDAAGIRPDELERLIHIRPGEVSAWRDCLYKEGRTNATIRRKLTTLRSLFSYLQTYGYTGANPAHGKFVKAPGVAKDGKTPGLTPKECRRLLDAPDPETPIGVRDRALLGVLAFTGCRVGELTRLRVGSYRTTGGHRVLAIMGKGQKERTVPLHPEAFERLELWLSVAGLKDALPAPLFPAANSARGKGFDGFSTCPLTRRAVERLVKNYARMLGFDPGVTVHSLRVTALTTARERGSDIIDLQDFAGHADPRTTLTYIRSRDRLSKSPAYVLNY